MKARVVVEVAGIPKEHVEEVTDKIFEKAKKDYKFVEAQLFEATEANGIWCSFFDALIEFKSVDELGVFCFDYMPSSVQIEEPERIDMTNAQLTNVFNDIMAKLHGYDALVKNLNAKRMSVEKKLKGAISSVKDEMKKIDEETAKERAAKLNESNKDEKEYDPSCY